MKINVTDAYPILKLHMSKIAENLYTVKKSIEATLHIQFVSIGGKNNKHYYSGSQYRNS